MFGKKQKVKELEEINDELVEKIKSLNSSVEHYLQVNKFQALLIKEQQDIISEKQKIIDIQEKTIVFLKENINKDNKSY